MGISKKDGGSVDGIVDLHEKFGKLKPNRKFKYAEFCIEAELIDNSIKYTIEAHPQIIKEGAELKEDLWFLNVPPGSEISSHDVFDENNWHNPNAKGELSKEDNCFIFYIPFKEPLEYGKGCGKWRIEYVHKNYTRAVGGFPKFSMFPLYFFAETKVDRLTYILKIQHRYDLKLKWPLSDGKLKPDGEPVPGENATRWDILNLQPEELFLMIAGVKLKTRRIIGAVLVNSAVAIGELINSVLRLFDPAPSILIAGTLVVVSNAIFWWDYLRAK